MDLNIIEKKPQHTHQKKKTEEKIEIRNMLIHFPEDRCYVYLF